MSINRKDHERNAVAYRASLATKPTNLTPPPTYGNATTTGLYTGNRMGSTRPETNKQHDSLPMGAQINRVSQKQKPQVAQTA